MKIFKFLAVALVAMLGFSACEEDCDHDFIEVDHSKDLVGTWTCFTENYAEALVINADGSVLSTGVEDGEYWENVKGNIKTVNNKMTLTFEDNDNFEGRFEMITGEAFTIYEENGVVEETISLLRIKQTLALSGQKYDYVKSFVTNVKGLDKDIEFMGITFNFAKMDGVGLDKFLKALCFAVEFPDANTMKYSYLYNGQIISLEAPIVVDGNKMTVKMSSKNAAFKDVVLYTFQDQDNTQMHIYMNATGFVNLFGNNQITIMEQKGLIDTNDAAAVKAVFDSIDEAIETINVSLVMTKAKESHGAVGDIPVR